jgi:hypothetical protein
MRRIPELIGADRTLAAPLPAGVDLFLATAASGPSVSISKSISAQERIRGARTHHRASYAVPGLLHTADHSKVWWVLVAVLHKPLYLNRLG